MNTVAAPALARTDANAERFRNRVIKALEIVDIRIGGTRPWDMQMFDEGLWADLHARGSDVLGEGYADKRWSTDDLDGFFERLFRSKPSCALLLGGRPAEARDRLYQVGSDHYDLPPEIFDAMFGEDPRADVYSMALWDESNPRETLGDAQDRKIHRLFQKGKMRQTDHPGLGPSVLDCGSGRGRLAEEAARKYGASVLGITDSEKHRIAAQVRCRGLMARFERRVFQELESPRRFDRIFSVGMIEHVPMGRPAENLRAYAEFLRDHVAERGLVVVHGIFNPAGTTDAWIRRIFPDGSVLSEGQWRAACEGILAVRHREMIPGYHYARTLGCWYANWKAACMANPGLVKRLGERFVRVWDYYLIYCRNAFRAGINWNEQYVLSHPGEWEDYTYELAT